MPNDPEQASELLSLNEKNLARVIGWVSVADSKAKFMFSVILVVLGYSVAQIGPLMRTSAELWGNSHFTPSVALFLLMYGTLGSLIASFIFLVVIIYPKRKPYTGKGSYFFFESIAKMSPRDFQDKMGSISVADAINELSDQTYNNAIVVKRKFDQLSMSVVLFLVSLGLLIVFSILHQIAPRIFLT